MASILKRNLSRKQTFIATGAIFLTLAFIFPMMTCGCASRATAIKAKTKSQVRQIAMATELYYYDFQEFPRLENLNKMNANEKVYYSGQFKTHDGQLFSLKTDDDFDNFVSYENERIEAKVIVWTKYKDKIIKSWK
ncbi:MAG: hypothetical protein NE334_09345 [Lentisphaeraceae bacterium]|nr:hypothetical protein [Lentisphaeraceae bacterium]